MKIRRGTGLMIVVAVLVVVGLVYMQQASPVRSAGPWYVAPGGSDSNACDVWSAPCAGINGVLAKPGFVAGDTILVAAGTYTGTGAEVVLLNKSTILSGGWDSTFSSQTGQSTLDGGGARRVVKVNAGVNATLDRIRVQNGWINPLAPYEERWGGWCLEPGNADVAEQRHRG